MKRPLVAVIDYGLGNVQSITNALNKVGAKAVLTNSKREILDSDVLVLPGVGAFSHGMRQLNRYDLVDAIYGFVSTNKPFLGICLGMQMMFDRSREFGDTKGLGLIAGEVEIMGVDIKKRQRLPHIGWNGICVPEGFLWENTIFSDIESGEDMYFVHSYTARPALQSEIAATTQYHDNVFCSAVIKGNIYGVQFHPEKSAESGLRILKGLINLA